jgi:hypothetical protein
MRTRYRIQSIKKVEKFSKFGWRYEMDAVLEQVQPVEKEMDANYNPIILSNAIITVDRDYGDGAVNWPRTTYAVDGQLLLRMGDHHDEKIIFDPAMERDMVSNEMKEIKCTSK